MMVAILPLVAMIVGILVYVLAHDTKVCELARLTFFAGILVTLVVTAKHVVTIG